MIFEFIFCAGIILVQLGIYLSIVLNAIRTQWRYNLLRTCLFVAAYAVITVVLNLLFIIDIKLIDGYGFAAIAVWVFFTIVLGKVLLYSDLFQLMFLVFVIFSNEYAVVLVSNHIIHLNVFSLPFSTNFSNYLYVSTFVLVITIPFIYYMITRLFKRVVESEINNSYGRYLFILPAAFFIALLAQYVWYSYETASRAMIVRDLLLLVVFKLCAYVVYGFILNMMLNMYNRLHAEEQERILTEQLKIQNERCKEMELYVENTAKLRHDWKYQIIMLDGLMKEKRYDELEEYLAQYMNDSFEIERTVYCSVNAINILLYYYKNLSELHNIKFEVKLDSALQTNVSDTELSSVIGNLLENATEACISTETHDRFITVKIKHVANVLAIVVENSYENEIVRHKKQFKSTKHSGKAVGIESIKLVVDKNGGSCRFKYKDNVFQACVLMLD